MRFWAALLAAVLCWQLAGSSAWADASDYENDPVAILRALDKITGKVSTLSVPVGEAVQFGSLSIVAHTCRKRPPEDEPESAAFLEIQDLNPGSSLPVRVFKP